MRKVVAGEAILDNVLRELRSIDLGSNVVHHANSIDVRLRK